MRYECHSNGDGRPINSQSYPFRTYGNNFNYPQGDSFASSVKTDHRQHMIQDKQILVESSIDVETRKAKSGTQGGSESEVVDRL